ncbi:Secernin-3 [Seminavis robusta]|uniref:Secernin-3 n=1 Tax=Seminavis robusta TaxID=568900 RepID=A0A9N8DPS8_9STRA|nr:Secernin-3 [Seminavis robusta]|eukprot:Sro203_g085630.1 Secernin-3 (340) ;mRNA; f:60644-61773
MAQHQPKQRRGKPVGCDTFVAFPPATPEGIIVFGKNSDRPSGEGQSIRRYESKTYQDDTSSQCQCTYISIPQVAKTHAVLLSQIDWMWGAEMGANEHGVVIGNEAVWTQDLASGQPEHLLGMDLVRLGLERGSSAKEAMQVITTLLETHGQGGACAEDDPSFTYHNSYLIVDPTEAWVLETSGKHWVAEKVTTGVRNISNCLSIRSKFDLTSKGIEDYARQKGYWKETGSFDFTQAFCAGSVQEETSDPRFCGGKRLLERHAGKGTMNKNAMIAILRDHPSGVCMHGGGFETTSSWVSEINMGKDGGVDGVAARHWVTGKPHPCKSDFFEECVVPPNNP